MGPVGFPHSIKQWWPTFLAGIPQGIPCPLLNCCCDPVLQRRTLYRLHPRATEWQGGSSLHLHGARERAGHCCERGVTAKSQLNLFQAQQSQQFYLASEDPKPKFSRAREMLTWLLLVTPDSSTAASCTHFDPHSPRLGPLCLHSSTSINWVLGAHVSHTAATCATCGRHASCWPPLA